MTRPSPPDNLLPQELNILQRLNESPNVLLRGPPGTGKTFAMRRLMERLESGTQLFDSSKADNPFDVNIPDFRGDTQTAWLTFHQSTEYEDFILGLRPEPAGESGVTLKPRAGVLLSLIDHVKDGNSAVVFIDELNRANVSKVFGEFISVMEADKRLGSDGDRTPESIEFTLPQLENETEIENPLGEDPIEFERPFYIPKQLYIVASMNSLDRSTAPLDSALARRFSQIPFNPDYDLLRDWVGVAEDDPSEWLSDEFDTAEDVGEIAVALLYRINSLLKATLGQDFQLGHGYLRSLKDQTDQDIQLRTLAKEWDGKIYPKLLELFRGRENQLKPILKVESNEMFESISHYDSELDQLGRTAAIETPELSSIDDDDELRRVLWRLAGGED